MQTPQRKMSLQKKSSCKTIGIFGSGQLGAMMAEAAHQLRFRVVIFDQVAGPAVRFAERSIEASFENEAALLDFASQVDVVTTEFENIPFQALEVVDQEAPVYPAPRVIQICQDRILEKQFLQEHHFPVAPWVPVTSLEELQRGISKLQGEAILKTATLGYDGKGQQALSPTSDLAGIWKEFSGGAPLQCVLEKKIPFVAEGSLIVARSLEGEVVSFFPQENRHRHGILESTLFPASFSSTTVKKMQRIGEELVSKIDLVGLLTIEFFILSDGNILINELAPRPHNSGHHTIESCRTSQFEQVIRAITGLPLGSAEPLHAAAMVNLLGDLWEEAPTGEPRWELIPKGPPTFLHLYGKKKARHGRKMGHLTKIGKDDEDPSLLLKEARALRCSLTA